MTASPLIPGKLPHALLQRFLQEYTHHDPRLIVPASLGEDAAVIDMGDRYLVAKTDPITFATDDVGHYAVHVNANDIAAMGATPRFFLATVLLPTGTSEQTAEDVFRSLQVAADSLEVLICGGHTEITPAVCRPVVVGQMLGEVEPSRLVRSSGLLPGDALLLTKGLAIEATAIIARQKRAELLARGLPPALLDRGAGFLHQPGISVVRDARIATSAGRVHAMHDPTEGGVATGLMELATASGVGMEIWADAMPMAPESERLCTAFDLDPLGVISSGALLIGCVADDAQRICTALGREGIPAARIGIARLQDFGLQLHRASETVPLPAFAADEITRLFGE
jgi:hydrogenase expression/formation protein HypE